MNLHIQIYFTHRHTDGANNSPHANIPSLQPQHQKSPNPRSKPLQISKNLSKRVPSAPLTSMISIDQYRSYRPGIKNARQSADRSFGLIIKRESSRSVRPAALWNISRIRSIGPVEPPQASAFSKLAHQTRKWTLAARTCRKSSEKYTKTYISDVVLEFCDSWGWKLRLG